MDQEIELKSKARYVGGVIALLVILGSGAVMTLYTLNQRATQIDPSAFSTMALDLEQLKIRLSDLENESLAVAVNAQPGTLGQAVPINRASQTTLETLTGIGPVRASAILEARNQGGPFSDYDDLHARVPKIPASVLKEIMPEITFE